MIYELFFFKIYQIFRKLFGIVFTQGLKNWFELNIYAPNSTEITIVIDFQYNIKKFGPGTFTKSLEIRFWAENAVLKLFSRFCHSLIMIYVMYELVCTWHSFLPNSFRNRPLVISFTLILAYPRLKASQYL